MKPKQLAIYILRLVYRTGLSSGRKPDRPHSIAILAPERYGDLILLTPLIHHLRLYIPDIQITLVGVSNMVYLFKFDSRVQEIYNGKKLLYRLFHPLFYTSYDWLYNPKDHPSFVFLLLTGRIKAKSKIGIEHRAHRGFYHHLLPVEKEWSKLKINCSLLSHLSVIVTESILKPYFPEGPVSDEIRGFTTSQDLVQTIVINLSASNEIRQWPTGYWQEILKEINKPVVIVSMPRQSDIKNRLETTCASVVASPPTKTLYDAAYLISRCRLLITPDTALIHVASSYNTPVIGLYTYRREYSKFAALSDFQEILFSESDTIQSIQPADVIAAYNRIRRAIENDPEKNPGRNNRLPNKGGE